MKAVMISIQPKWCELIASGKKTIEVRKTRPKIDTPFKCYIYCTKDNKTAFNNHNGNMFLSPKGWQDYSECNGKVIGEFVCDRIEEYTFFTNLAKFSNMGLPCGTFSSYLIFEDDYKKMCLPYNELKKYGNGETLYGLHISDLVIYDKPREIGEFFTPMAKRPSYMLERPFSSWGYVEEKENEK